MVTRGGRMDKRKDGNADPSDANDTVDAIHHGKRIIMWSISQYPLHDCLYNYISMVLINVYTLFRKPPVCII